VRGHASTEYETLVEYSFVFNGVAVVYSITTEEDILSAINPDGSAMLNPDASQAYNPA